MAGSILCPELQVPLTGLSKDAFEPFGTVVEGPSTTDDDFHPIGASLANQGTALKWPNVTSLTSFYDSASSHVRAKPSISLFRCKPRRLRAIEDLGSQPLVASLSDARSSDQLLSISILERHPFTSQTFVPMVSDCRTALFTLHADLRLPEP